MNNLEGSYHGLLKCTTQQSGQIDPDLKCECEQVQVICLSAEQNQFSNP
jgi:hypothetical protein